MTTVKIRFEVAIPTVVEITVDLSDQEIFGLQADGCLDDYGEPSVRRAHLQGDLSWRTLGEHMTDVDCAEMDRLILKELR